MLFQKRHKINLSKKRAPHSVETKNKISATIKKLFKEGKLKTLGIKTKELWKNTEYRKHMIKIHTGKILSKQQRKKISQSNKGRISYWKGKKYPIEARKKISLSMKGKNQGKQNPNWKGGITNKNIVERTKFRRTIQKQVFERDNYTCQLCGNKGVDLQVDHIQSWAEYVELRFCIDNCRTLCQQCHYKITYGKPMPPTVRAWGHNLKEVTNYTNL